MVLYNIPIGCSTSNYVPLNGGIVSVIDLKKILVHPSPLIKKKTKIKYVLLVNLKLLLINIIIKILVCVIRKKIQISVSRPGSKVHKQD